MRLATKTEGSKVVHLALPKTKRAAHERRRFSILPFTNATGTQSWRVSGTNRQGKQIRENFADLKFAQCRQIELEAAYFARAQTDSALRATRLSDTQLRIAESAFLQLNADDEMLRAVAHWLRHGKQHSVAESLRLDEAVQRFNAWLDGERDANGNG